MPKATMTTKRGTRITIEGEPGEIAALLKQIDPDVAWSRKDRKIGAVLQKKDRARPTPINLISTLIDGGFFKKPKDLAAVKVALEEMGHFYPATTLSPALLRLVRKRQLRRIKEKKRWLYIPGEQI